MSIARTVPLLVGLAASAHAQCLTWSDAFAPGGMNGAAKAFVVHDRGFGPRLVAGGQFSVEDGALARGVVELADGRWRGFPEQLDGDVNDLLVVDLGQGPQLVVGGTFSQSSSGTSLSRVARWEGSAWAPLGAGFGNVVHALCVFDDGSGPKLYAGGAFQNSGSALMMSVAVWNGSAWAGIGDVVGAPEVVYALEVFDDGSGPALYAGGYFTTAGGVPAANIARYDGSSWSAVGAGTNERVRTLRSWDSPDGPRLVVGGRFTTAGGMSANHVAAYDGASWSALAGGVTTSIPFGAAVEKLTTLDLGAGPELYVAGTFDTVDGQPGKHLAKWNGSSWSSLGDSLVGEAPNPFLTAIEGVTLAGSTFLAISGGFESIGGVVGPDVAAYDANGFRSLGAQNGGIQGGYAYCSLAFDDGSGPSLFVGGSFRFAGGVNANGIARYDGTSFHALSSGTLDSVLALASFDDGSGTKLYAGGYFVTIGEVLTPTTVARWNGSTWEALPGGLPPWQLATVHALAVFDDGDGPALYAGSNSTTSKFARWRDGVWTPITVPLNGSVSALTVHDFGAGPRLVLGGSFNNSAGQYMLGVAQFDGTSLAPISLGFAGLQGGLAFVEALHVHDDGNGAKLYAAGSFASADLETAWGIARFDGGAWHGLPGGGLTTSGGMPGEGKALHTFDDGRGAGPALYVGGRFDVAGGVAATNVARFDGQSWQPLADGVGTTLPPPAFTRVYTLGSIGSGGDRRLVAAGAFTHAGTVLSQNVASWSSCGETGRTFCFGDGSSTACPCGNASAPGARAGCLNSLASGGTLRGRGEASLSSDSLVLDGAGMTNSSALYFQGVNVSNGGLGVTFGDGITCVAGPFIRLGTKTNAAGASSYPVVGDLAVSVRGQVSAAVTRRYGVRYRNPASYCTPDTFNYTNALEVVWRP